MKTTYLLTLAPVLVVMASGMPAQAQSPVEIDSKASYEQALACYEYYDVAQQVADAGAAKAAAGSEEQKALQMRVVVNKVLKLTWNKQIDATKGGKSNQVVDEDLARVAATIVADANAGLGGDEAASERYEAIQVTCKTFEKAK
jgi:hypothetical protein